MARSNEWTRDQLLIALRLYTRTPFGKLDSRNPEIITTATRFGRSPNALAMKVNNFAHIDPKLKRKGLTNVSQADRKIWQEFEANPTRLALAAEEAAERQSIAMDVDDDPPMIPSCATEGESIVRIRKVQSFFRTAVLVAYDSRCAITGLGDPALLTASHIIPWNADEKRRADPTNGLLLNALLDRAFDRGLISFDNGNRVLVSKRLQRFASEADLDSSLSDIKGREIVMPERFLPDPTALAYHRENIFVG